MMVKSLQAILLLLFATLPLSAQKNFSQTGDASFYSDELHGKYTASGEKYDTLLLTAAHMTLPFGTFAQITNMKNGKTVVVKINDRGPFVPGRVIDLSKAAAKEINLLKVGTTRVKIEVVDKSKITAKPEKNTNPSVPETKTVTQPKNDTQEKPETKENVLVNGLVKINAVSNTDTGFGVQIGSYKEFQNVVEIITNVEQPCFVLLNQKEGEDLLFKVIVGQKKTREQAENLKNTLSATYPGCFIIDLEKINK